MLTRRIHPAPILLLLLLIGGCQSLKEIPLFNPEASLRNKIASAREFRTEMNNQIVEARTNGWITQEQIDQSFSPSMDASKAIVDEAELLLNAGDTSDGNNKVDAVKAILMSVRKQLESMRRERA